MKKILLFSLSAVLLLGCQSALASIEKVKNVDVAGIYAKKVKLEWQAVDSAEHYQVKIMRKRDGHYNTVRKVTADTNSKLVKKLKAETKYYFKVRAYNSGQYGPYSKKVSATTNAAAEPTVADANIIFLHHSTGENIWNGGVSSWFEDYNANHGINYQIAEQAFPKDDPYGWNNYPYDYWNIWVNNAGDNEYLDEPTLEILTASYDVIVFKHCFPVSGIEENVGADISSDYKSIENYELQYNTLKDKMHEFPNTKFIVWTGAALISGETNEEQATRAQEFFSWVKDTWDEDGDNIYVWDFYQLETEGGLYMLDEHSAGDSHPNEEFSQEVAPYFSQRVADVINGNGDTGNLTGE